MSNGEEQLWVPTKEEKLEEAAKKFRNASVSMLQAFLFLEETLKETAQLCVDITVILEEDKPANILEGDINVN